MIPGEIRTAKGSIELNEGRKTISIRVANSGDRPVQIGSHYHFAEVNRELVFDRKAAYGMRLDIAAGTAVRFEPGEEKIIELVEFGGLKEIYGLNQLTEGSLATEETAFLKKIDAFARQGGETT
ncbi:urease subunit beta [Halalkalibacter oceani]|uniref:Urease subunit beta n=1 Tax=Halalkalibacter oceani TaxID=1653776 RepID=A0A9X2DRZ4_9BACI|nr:urease subunit beta [Halalkalibacter oceani]MCM3715352.1 urease subunit beta [Halalkalibacter oceani]